jgi:hypothetical protein
MGFYEPIPEHDILIPLIKSEKLSIFIDFIDFFNSYRVFPQIIDFYRFFIDFYRFFHSQSI